MSSVTTWYLELTAPSEMIPRPRPPGLRVLEAELKEYRFNRYLYQLVGQPWQWKDKLAQDDEAWREYAESDDLRTWVAYFRGSIAGYYELQRQPGDVVQLMYFGLAPRFIGAGFGGYLLTHAIRSAFGWGEVSRVWVHTCSLDHDAALHNYQARGFRVYRTETSPG